MTRQRLAAWMRTVWADALHVAVDDSTDFFDAGGTSLSAMRIIAALQAECRARIPLRTIFDHSRFDDFVATVAQAVPGADTPSRVPS